MSRFIGALLRQRAAALCIGLLGWSNFAWAAEDISARVAVTRSGLVFNRTSNSFDTTVTLRNVTASPIAEPLELEVSSITAASVTLANSAGFNGRLRPFVQVPGGLAPGGQKSVVLQFANPQRVVFSISTSVLLPTLVAAPITVPTTGPGPAYAFTWPVPLLQSSLALEVRPFALLPLANSGKPPRLNALAYVGQRLFVLDEKDGKVFEITGGVVNPWFDVRSAIQAATGRQMYPPQPNPLALQDNAHTGLRSLAFHPNFASNGKFYTSLLEERPAALAGHHYLSDVSAPLVADSVLVEWTATNTTTTMNVAPGSYREVFRVGIPVLDHPIKQIMFRPGAKVVDADYGLLYVAHGDASVQSAIAGGGMGNDARGKILRINPLQGVTLPYTVPASNPSFSLPMIAEAYSIGHRNPHHLAFARDGTLIVAEDGRDNVDEVNIVRSGHNYGWPAREGTYVHLPAPHLPPPSTGFGATGSTSLVGGIGPIPANDAALGYTYPAMQFLHTGVAYNSFTGQALGGGYAVENGSVLSGKYFALEFVKTGDIFFGELGALKAATTQGAPNTLTQAPISRAKVLFDHDNNPNTPALLLNSMGEVLRGNPASNSALTPNPNYVGNLSQSVTTANPLCNPSATNAANVCRADTRYGQGPKGELYLMSKVNRQVYLVTNSLPP